MAMESTCAVCLGTGNIRYEHRHESGAMEWGTRLCGCREVVPAREGKAHWWSLETLFERELEIPIGRESFLVEVKAEVPIDSQNYRVQRLGNRYYPTLIDVHLGSAELSLHPDTAREIAKALIEAADMADKTDLPDTDACGHWAPCDHCKSATARAAEDGQ